MHFYDDGFQMKQTNSLPNTLPAFQCDHSLIG